MMTRAEAREKLIALLNEEPDPHDHLEAEDLLLAVVGDDEIAWLWKEARKFWWYA